MTEHEDRGLNFRAEKWSRWNVRRKYLREVKEETGAAVRHLKYVGQYKVLGREKVIVKNIYFADIEKLEKQADYFETKVGAVQRTAGESPRNKNSVSL